MERLLMQNTMKCYLNHNNKFVVCDAGELDIFRYPCHLDAITLLICIGGSLDGNVNLKPYHLGADSILVSFPEDILQTEGAQELKAYAVMISKDYLDSLDIETLSRTHYYLVAKRNGMVRLPHYEIENLKNYLQLLINCRDWNDNTENKEITRHLMSAFVINIITLMKKFQPQSTYSGNLTRGKGRMVDNFLELLAEHHTHERRLVFYADKLCVTPKYLSTVIKKATGYNATEWICRFVTLEAQSLLKYSGNNIQQIARHLNFPTQSAFGKYFKKQTGRSPKDYMYSTFAEAKGG